MAPILGAIRLRDQKRDVMRSSDGERVRQLYVCRKESRLIKSHPYTQTMIFLKEMGNMNSHYGISHAQKQNKL